ncbi:cytochrome b5-like heme/steroid binding domain-containing protein [Dipodascopsis uninucleata]
MMENRQKNRRAVQNNDDSNDIYHNSYWSIVRSVLICILLNFLLSYYITNTFFWEKDSKFFRPSYVKFFTYKSLHQLGVPSVIKSTLGSALPSSLQSSEFFTFEYPRILTEAELAYYDGSDPHLPVYVGLNGSVYDVTENRLTYGPGGPYHFFAGRDAARAFVTGCFSSDLTHDLRGLNSEQAEIEIQRWQNFFGSVSTKYWYIGEVIHGPLLGPIPGPCQAPKYVKA